ncbi:pantoate--beta-alanine ligase [Cocleimonas sp. KMM 6892]|uniref:pantoate--beta-alanine ligase n=1 Tax=unclassified Cocleimonas TaxID=2639732 RepID=UPI002DBB4E3E|nr:MULTISPECIES: pantoate--beta-alanine ligase [unclassified Cocleimonas]MEB8431688.1 pantoate--beta-alanine ligase [Cocleimonas sp. KMM 6892]MEC4713540.1 pantoate--beta-alanine ligase [Cocleimonas sp. KMM 6895]MEC4742871.1 pantoate--beta-alanine ligase [Cocleimonas sp. KMM 6896]
MLQANDKDELRVVMRGYRARNETTAFVPTLGNLHDGHLSLVRKAKEIADRVVVSIFINPTQFDKAEDLAAYPRTLDSDLALLKSEGVDLVFLPTAEEMYPAGSAARVEVDGISEILEGDSRPGHFSGVATIVAKLFNLVRPDISVFGEKDFQQLMLIRRMESDLDFGIEIIAAPTAREETGLAMSSRNNYLDDEQRNITGPKLYQQMQKAQEKILGGERDYLALQAESIQALNDKGFNTDYFEVRNAADLSVADADSKSLVLLVSAWLGKARLIDNITIDI